MELVIIICLVLACLFLHVIRKSPIAFRKVKDGIYDVIYITKEISKSYYVTHLAVFSGEGKNYFVRFYSDDLDPYFPTHENLVMGHIFRIEISKGKIIKK